MTKTTSPRIAPLEPAEMTEVQRSLCGSGLAGNFLATLVRHEALFQGWLGFSNQLVVHGHLSPRERELVVLRVGDLGLVEHVVAVCVVPDLLAQRLDARARVVAHGPYDAT